MTIAYTNLPDDPGPLYDFFGNEVKIGDKIAYATSRGSTTKMNAGIVAEIFVSNPDYGRSVRKAKVYRTDRTYGMNDHDRRMITLEVLSRAIILSRADGSPVDHGVDKIPDDVL